MRVKDMVRIVNVELLYGQERLDQETLKFTASDLRKIQLKFKEKNIKSSYLWWWKNIVGVVDIEDVVITFKQVSIVQ